MPTARSGLRTFARHFQTTSGLARPHAPSISTRLSASKTQCRSYAQFRRPFDYQRFQATKNLFQRWRARPTFYYEAGGLGAACGGFYVFNLEEVPVSRRRRFNVISPSYEAESGQQLYQQILQEYQGKILPPSHPNVQMVQRVLDRLLPHSGLPDDGSWEVHVIESEEKNAFVIPGGKVFVFSGILPICQGEQGLAAVLGHEIAHNVAHHAAEKMSGYAVLLPVAIVASVLLGVGDYGLSRMFVDLAFLRPGGRKQESEADYIGLLMMSEACYDPKAALTLWQRMEKAEEHAPPQFLSTHPSNHNRIASIEQWLPEAEAKAEQSDCANTSSYVRSFQQAFQ